MATSKPLPTWTNRPNISDDTLQRVYGLGAKVVKKGKKWTVKKGRVPTTAERVPTDMLNEYNAGELTSFYSGKKAPRLDPDSYTVIPDRYGHGFFGVRRTETTGFSPEQKQGLTEYDTETGRLKGLYSNDLAAYDAGTNQTADKIGATYNTAADAAARDSATLNASMEGLAKLAGAGYNQQDPTAQVAAQTATQGAAANSAANLYSLNNQSALLRDAGASTAASFRNQSAAGRGQIQGEQRQLEAGRMTGRREYIQGTRSANQESAAAAEQQAYERDQDAKNLSKDLRGQSLEAIATVMGIQGDFNVAALREDGANARNTQDNETNLQKAQLDAVAKAEANAQRLQVEIAKLQQRANEETGRNRRAVLAQIQKKKAAQKKAKATARKEKQKVKVRIGRAALSARQILEVAGQNGITRDQAISALADDYDLSIEQAENVFERERRRKFGLGGSTILSGSGSI